MGDTSKLVAAQKAARKAFNELADEIDEHQQKLDKAKLSFSATGAAGGIMTIVGLALLPVTFGASAGLAIAGGVIGGLSAAGNIGSLITDKVLSSKTMKKAEEQLVVLAHEEESIQKLLPTLLAQLKGEEIEEVVKRIRGCKDIRAETKETVIEMIKERIKNLIPEASLMTNAVKVARVLEDVITAAIALDKSMAAGKALGAMAAGAGAAASAANAGRAVATAADVGVDVAKTAGKVGLNGAKVAGVAAAGVGLAVDLGGIIFYSIKVHKQKPCDIARKIRGVADCLK